MHRVRPKESLVSRELAKAIRAKATDKFGGAFVVKTTASEEQAAGLPDLVVCWRWFYGLEVKIADNVIEESVTYKSVTLTKKQQYRLQSIANCGGQAYVLIYVWKTDTWIAWQFTSGCVDGANGFVFTGKLPRLLEYLFA